MQNAPQTLNLPVYVQDNAYGMKNGSSFTLDPGTSEIGKIDCLYCLFLRSLVCLKLFVHLHSQSVSCTVQSLDQGS